MALSTLGRYRSRLGRQAVAGSNALLAVEVCGRVPAPIAATGSALAVVHVADSIMVSLEIEFAHGIGLQTGLQHKFERRAAVKVVGSGYPRQLQREN